MTIRRVANGHCGQNNAGFTLIELLVALSVIGVAVSVYVSLYTSSLEIGESAQNRTVAIGLAESQLQHLAAHPESYHWDIPQPLSLEKIPVRLSKDDPKAGNRFPLPASMPADKRAFNRQENTHEKFRWHAFAQLHELDSAQVQVTITVNWREGGKERALAISSIIPRSKVGGLAL